MGRASTATAARPRDADTKLARSRLSVLELAKELGNVAEACRQRGLDRRVRSRVVVQLGRSKLRASAPWIAL